LKEIYLTQLKHLISPNVYTSNPNTTKVVEKKHKQMHTHHTHYLVNPHTSAKPYNKNCSMILFILGWRMN